MLLLANGLTSAVVTQVVFPALALLVAGAFAYGGKKLVEILKVNREQSRQIESQNHKLDLVEAQMKPNGGSSLKDQLVRIENTIQSLDRRQIVMAERLNTHMHACRGELPDPLPTEKDN